MEVPFFFYGGPGQATLIVNNQLVGWGKSNANYFFQMWRDSPSHTIHYRNLLGRRGDYLPDFLDEPVNPPEMNYFRYDYLGNGEIPAGFWLKFTMGVDTTQGYGYIKSVSYDLYDEYSMGTATNAISKDQIAIDPLDFLILVTNVGVSSHDGEMIDDPIGRNVLANEDDIERRRFNSKYFEMYFDFLERRIEEQVQFVEELLGLSGAIVVADLMRRNRRLDQKIRSYLSKSGDVSLPILLSLNHVLTKKGERPLFDSIPSFHPNNLELFAW